MHPLIYCWMRILSRCSFHCFQSDASFVFVQIVELRLTSSISLRAVSSREDDHEEVLRLCWESLLWQNSSQHQDMQSCKVRGWQPVRRDLLWGRLRLLQLFQSRLSSFLCWTRTFLFIRPILPALFSSEFAHRMKLLAQHRALVSRSLIAEKVVISWCASHVGKSHYTPKDT